MAESMSGPIVLQNDIYNETMPMNLAEFEQNVRLMYQDIDKPSNPDGCYNI